MQFIEGSSIQHEGEYIMLGYSLKKKSKALVDKCNLCRIVQSYLSECYISHLYDDDFKKTRTWK